MFTHKGTLMWPQVLVCDSMVRSKRAQAARERFCERGEQMSEVQTYIARERGNSMVSTISPAARSLLDISEGDELTQFIDIDRGVIIIEVGEEGDQ